MSLPAPIDSIGGRLARSTAGGGSSIRGGASPLGACSLSACAGGDWASSLREGDKACSRFSRDHRARKLSSSLIDRPPTRAQVAPALRKLTARVSHSPIPQRPVAAPQKPTALACV